MARDRRDRARAASTVDLTVGSARSCSPNPVVAASGTFGHGDEVAPPRATRRSSARSP